MALMVWTSRVSYRGADALNVTRKSGREGLAFAPSWSLLGPALRARRALELKQVEEHELAESIERGDGGDAGLPTVGFELDVLEREWHEAWDRYVVGFHDEMRQSYRTNRAAWDALLARSVVTLCCYCTDHTHCHRTILARDILPKLGASYLGER